MWRSGICSRRNKIREILNSENETRKIPERPFIPFGSCGAVKNCLFYSPFKNAGGGRKKTWHGFFTPPFSEAEAGKHRERKGSGSETGSHGTEFTQSTSKHPEHIPKYIYPAAVFAKNKAQRGRNTLWIRIQAFCNEAPEQKFPCLRCGEFLEVSEVSKSEDGQKGIAYGQIF